MAGKNKVSSIFDLAKETGVSYATVSRVLNGKGRISEETRAKVLAAAEKFSFKPKMQARRLTVSLLFGHFGCDMLYNDYFLQTLGALIRHLALHDVALEFHSQWNLSSMRMAMLDGVIGMPWDQTSRDMLLAISERIPCITLNDCFSDSISSVGSDHYQGGRMAAEHLLSKGHRTVSIAVHGSDSYGNNERIRGFSETLGKAGCHLPSSLIFDYPKHSILDAISNTLKANGTALFLGISRGGELVATSRMMKVGIPEELSAIVMEGVNSSKFLTPPMTSIDQNLDMIAAKAVDTLLEKIKEGKSALPEHLLLDSNTLIERESVKNLNSGAGLRLA